MPYQYMQVPSQTTSDIPYCSTILFLILLLQALGTIEEYETMNGLDGVKPARTARQREILERPWPLELPKSSKSERTRVEKPRMMHKGFTSYKQYF